MPASRAVDWMKEFEEYTTNKKPRNLRELPAELNGQQCVLVVWNHPYWDAESIGPEERRKSLDSFLEKSLPFLHALESNGMRSRREDREALRLGTMLGVPVVSGGDRHGSEANAVWNLSRAQSFEEFVGEVGKQKHGGILLMSQFVEPLQLRLMENAWHALADAPGKAGRRHWMSRVFLEVDGKAAALSQFTGTRFHRVIDKFRRVLGLVVNPVLRPARKLPFLGNQEGGL